jgi:uncharacterized protein YprB with RNaseH-like and TPR domain/predicted nuclease with RNAse H fold/dephospho-CoA kinase
MADQGLKTISESKNQDLCLSSMLLKKTNMLLCTFQHLKGISKKKEQDLWREGIIYWEDFESIKNKLPLLKDISRPHDSLFNLSRIALAEENTEFFAKMLPSQEHYRIALTFPQKTLFLDIETTGLSRYYDTITIVGWSLGKNYEVFIKGDDDKILREAISQAKIIVTFNGSIFDLPFLRQEFKHLHIPICHIDLRFLAKRVGLSGGQKTIEKVLGIERPENISDIRGYVAPILWYRYRWGEESALMQLISYNHADIEGMKIIFDKVIDRLLEKEKLPIQAHSVYRFSKELSEIRWANESSQTDGIRIYPYKGTKSPTISLEDLFNLFLCGSDFRVVGIDLTGSETRPSGWCLLDNDHAITKLLGSDAVIIKEALDSKPNLISIDSPLSLPIGRISVKDDDPGRKDYGIMRSCEKILKKRGVNVYPSLIPSMQNLTARGIRLANYFRSKGIPVIESYPGAAQDIMNIPRKRASLELLANGLSKFGIKGDFIKNSVCHDELDAITSAIVGFFFWSGKFEGLGNDDEEYLIIPDIKNTQPSWRERRVIGFSGPIAAGKTTASSFLESKGFHYGRFSMVIAGLVQSRGMQPNRQTLQETGQEINQTKGQRWLGKKLIQMLPKRGNLVIDGLRFPEDHAFLVETFGPAFLHIHIDAPEDTRLERYIIDGGTKEEFVDANSHQVESNVPNLSSLAHIIVDNASDMDSFKNEISKTVNLMQNDKGECLLCQ